MGVEIIVPQLTQQQPWRLPLHLKPAPATQGWPSAMEGPTCWDSTTFSREEDVILCLTDEEAAEVEAAVEHFNGMYPALMWNISLSGFADIGNRAWLVRQRSHPCHFPTSHPRPQAVRARGRHTQRKRVCGDPWFEPRELVSRGQCYYLSRRFQLYWFPARQTRRGR